jgi:hypothetical protein
VACCAAEERAGLDEGTEDPLRAGDAVRSDAVGVCASRAAEPTASGTEADCRYVPALAGDPKADPFLHPKVGPG